jgi:hypothetical protein
MSWFDIRVKTERQKFDAIRSIIRTWPQEVAKEIYFPELEKIAENGKEYIRYIILASDTDTGRRRANNGGNGPGRVDSGTMYDSVRARVNVNKDSFSALVGWLDGRPGYAIFQEHGTKNGVKGMEAIQQAQEYMLSEIRKLKAGGKITGSPTGN